MPRSTMTPDLATAVGTGTYWAVVGITVLLVAIVVVLHYEALERLNRFIPTSGLRSRPRVLALIFGILLAHVLEIWLFGIGIHWAALNPARGGMLGVEGNRLLDAIYLSAITYTTVGYGDLVPYGPIRFLLGTEALTGLVMITWSASFTYLEMQRYWKVR